MSNGFVVISGCSGGGKSTLLTELGRRGYVVVDEPGRRIVADELASGGTALPWVDLAAFARRAIEIALADRAAARRHEGWTFFDRGLIDAVVAFQHVTGEPVVDSFGGAHRYHPKVFLAPPWPEIYAKDDERRHSLDEASAEYERLHAAYKSLGYELVILPTTDVLTRATFILRELGVTPDGV